MIRSPQRAIALVVLILSFAMLSGIGPTVAALDDPRRVDACCDRNEAEAEPGSGACAESGCHCLSCLPLGTASASLRTCPLQVTISAFWPSPALCPDGFSTAIDYPPETA